MSQNNPPVAPKGHRFFRPPGAISYRGSSKTGLYRDVAKGLLTKPIKISGARASGWPESELIALNLARIAGKTVDQIRALVKQLEAARTEVVE